MKADEFVKQLENDQDYQLLRAKNEAERKKFLANVEEEQLPIVNLLKARGLGLDRLDDLFRRDLTRFPVEIGSMILGALSAEKTSQRTLSDCGRLLEKLPLDSQAVSDLIELTAELYEKRPADEIALGSLVQAIAAHRKSADDEMVAILAKTFGAGPLRKLLLEKRPRNSSKRVRRNGKTHDVLRLIRRWVGLN